MTWRRFFYELLEDDESPSAHRRAVDLGLITLIVIAVVAAALESVPDIYARWALSFVSIEFCLAAIFSLEYLLRLWVCVEDRAGRYSQPFLGRLRYALTPSALVDLFAILPMYVAFLMPDSLIFLRTLRLVRIIKLTRYSPAIALLEVVIYNQRSALAAGATIVFALLMIVSGFAYLAESRVQPEAFGTIPDAMWWTVVTMTTVGYGDVTPVTLAGKLIAAVASFAGLALIALPTAILAEGFAQELQKRDFNKSAEAVAELPQFDDLSAPQLTRLVQCVSIRTLPPRYHVIRRGEYPDTIYFVKSGMLFAQSPDGAKPIGKGECFGGKPLLSDAQPITVTTLATVTLIQLRKSDMLQLSSADPELVAKIEKRIAQSPF